MQDAPPTTTVPPKHSHAVPLVASLAFFVIWVGLTWGATWIAPMIASAAHSIGFAIGVDVLPGWPEEGT